VRGVVMGVDLGVDEAVELEGEDFEQPCLPLAVLNMLDL